VRPSDELLLNNGYWLNDAIISFAFEYIHRQELLHHKDILFVDPAAAFIIAHEQDTQDIQDIVQELDLAHKSIVFVPINDNEALVSTGGSHWSVLVLHKSNNSSWNAWHLDSCQNKNIQEAKHLADKLGLGINLTTYAASPQQRNGYDCGVFVIANAWALGEMFLEGIGKQNFEACLQNLSKRVSQHSIPSLREKLKTFVKNMKQKRERKESE
jgi:sentrin-specific protease 8